MRSRWIAVVLLTAPGTLAAQVTDVPRRGVTLAVEAATFSSWSLDVRTGSFVNRQATYDRGATVGLRLGVSPGRRLGLFGAAEWNGGGFGDSSGFSVLEAGVECRFPTRSRLVPKLVAAGGKVDESGGIGFWQLSGGAGAELYLTRKLFFGLELRGMTPVGTTDSRDTGGETVSVSAGMVRLHLQFGIHF